MSTPISVITLYRTPLVYKGRDVMDSAAHAACLASSPKQVVTGCTFQRQNRLVRVPLSQDTAGMYNYLSYVNNGRTFYAYITTMEYRNDNLTIVSYENDYWHTYVNDIRYNKAYVVRRTVAKSEDVAGAFLEPEPIAPTQQMLDTLASKPIPANRVIIMSTRDSGGAPNTQPMMFNGSYSAAKLYNYTPAQAKNFLDSLINAGYEDAIAGIYSCNSEFVGSQDELSGNTIGGAPFVVSWSLGSAPSAIRGYTPKNKKLLTSPFCDLHLLASNGGSVDYAFELFNPSDVPAVGTPITFNLYAALGSGCTITAIPQYYNTSSVPEMSNIEYGLSFDMPTGNWSGNTGAAWWSANALSMALGAVGSLAGGVIGGNPFSVGLSAAGVGVDFYSAAVKADRMSYKMHGTMASGNVGAAVRGLGFIAYFAHPTPEETITIDNYFSAYGYAINRVEDPTPNKRSVWDYIQTDGASCSVAVGPANAEREINLMLDSGLRVWHDFNSFGDLSVDNG